MIRIVVLFLLLSLPLISKGQSKFESLRKKLVDNKTCEYVYNFENNYAVFRTFTGKMGLIDTTGNVIIKPTYEYINNNPELKNIFEAGINSNKKYKRGFIDVKGNVRIPFEYEDVYYFGNDLIRVSKNNKTGVTDTLNKTILPLKFDNIMGQEGILFVESNNSLDLFDTSGKQITNFKAIDIEYFTGDKSIVTLQNKNTLIINNQGITTLNTIKNHKFEKVIDSNTYIIQNTVTHKKGVINSTGKFEIECKYDDISSSNSIFIVKEKNKYGIVTKTDSVLKPLVYDALYPINYQENKYFQNQFIATKENFEGIINPFLEEEIIPIRYKNVQTFSDYYIVTTLDNKNGVFSESGDRIINEDYEFYTISQNKIFATKNTIKYLLNLVENSYSEIEIQVDEFAKKESFNNGFTKSKFQIFKNGNQFGVLSNTNKIVVPCAYDAIENIYSTSEFVVKKNKKFGVVNAGNQITLEIKYDSFQIVKEYIRFEIKNPKTKKIYFVNNSSDY